MGQKFIDAAILNGVAGLLRFAVLMLKWRRSDAPQKAAATGILVDAGPDVSAPPV